MTNTKIFTAVLVGCGGMSKAWLQAAQSMNDVKVIGLVDTDISKAKELQQQFGLEDVLVTGDLDEALSTVRPDAVFDCTVPEAHYEITLQALNKGCHVLGEKPMTDSLDRAQEMVKAAKLNNRTYAVIKNRRYDPNIIRYRQTVESSPIGDITTVNADFFKGVRFGGFRAVMEHVLLRDMAIHSFDQARFICGKEPISVYCHEWNPKGSWFKHGASAVAVFEMTDDVIFNYRGSWCAQGLPTSWQCKWRTIGTDGTAVWDGEDHIRCQYMAASGDGKLEACDFTPPEMPPLHYQKHAGVMREFVDCVKDGRTPQTDCAQNLKSFAMVEAAVKSAETGKKVPIQIQ